jgi:DNA-directed RNA polymerase subunit RPC12/RpoP
MIIFECRACKIKLTAADGYAGKNMACPNCKAKITIPLQNEAAPPPEKAGIL